MGGLKDSQRVSALRFLLLVGGGQPGGGGSRGLDFHVAAAVAPALSGRTPALVPFRLLLLALPPLWPAGVVGTPALVPLQGMVARGRQRDLHYSVL